jgi:hypothetical protein
MKIDRLTLLALLLTVLLATLVASLPAVAQEEEEVEEDDRAVRFFVVAEVWMPRLAGLEFNPATQINPDNPFDTQVLDYDYSNESGYRYRLGMEFGKNLGAVSATYFTHDVDYEVSDVTPGVYIFGQTLTHPFFSGFNNDGLADGFTGVAQTSLADLRIDYHRTAFQSSRIRGDWFVGYRRIEFERGQNVDYTALISGLPPLIPPFVDEPRPDLEPGTDSAFQSSEFRGRGIEAGMDFLMPVWQQKILLEGGFSLAALRGKNTLSWGSTTHYYVLDGAILSPPYDEFNDPDDVAGMSQSTFVTGLNTESQESSAQVLEAYFGLRWSALRFLDVYGGYRSTRYDGIVTDLRSDTAVDYFGVNTQGVSETDRSVTLEGFYFGLAFRF